VNETSTDDKFSFWFNSSDVYLGAGNFNDSLNIVVFDPASNLSSLNYGVQIGFGSIVWNAVDLTVGIATYNSGIAIPWSKLYEGSNKIWITAIDVAGNTKNYFTTLTINKDTQNPAYDAGSHLSAYANTWIKSSSQLPGFVNITFTDNNPGSGLKNVKYIDINSKIN